MRWFEEALPADARPTDEVFGNARVWLTERWMYLVVEGTGKVVNCVKNPEWEGWR